MPPPESAAFTGTRRCRCGHPFSLHRVNPDIGDRNECWALNDNQLVRRWCQCRSFLARHAASHPPGTEATEHE